MAIRRPQDDQLVYNSFGELERQTDATGKIIRYDMDQLGRVTDRHSDEGHAQFQWDSQKIGLPSSQSLDGHLKSFSYDSLARPTTTTTVIDNSSYSVVTQYDDNYGRPIKLSYPNGLSVKYDYNARGYLTTESNAASGYVYRQITSQDTLGNTTAAQLAGGKLTLDNEYSSTLGQLLRTRFYNASNATVQDIQYTGYDSYGNITNQQRNDLGFTATETFTYDGLHRLKSSARSIANNAATINYSYDAVGNILYKSDYSTSNANAYQYNNGTNQISSISLKNGGNETYVYDAAGNLTHRNGTEEVTYNAFNKPLTIKRKGSDITLSYGADIMRYKQFRKEDGKEITTHYIGKLYEVELEGSETRIKAYISDVAIVSDTIGQQNQKKIRFTLKDRLGSSATFTDQHGTVTAKRHFDPFGKPMGGDWRDPGANATLTDNPLDTEMATRRGFTDHEHLDKAELIHMNGRVYDYNVGRFLSVDPVIQSPTNSQSMNPYSYIMNNPMAGTDATGYTCESNTHACADDQNSDELTKDVYVSRPGSRIKVKAGSASAGGGAGAKSISMSNGTQSRSATKIKLDNQRSSTFVFPGAPTRKDRPVGFNTGVESSEDGVCVWNCSLREIIASEWKNILKDTMTRTRDVNQAADILVDITPVESVVEGTISIAEGDVSGVVEAGVNMASSKLKIIDKVADGVKNLRGAKGKDKDYSLDDFAEVGHKISQKQMRHIRGRKEYRGGGYLDSLEDAQTVLDNFHSDAATIIGKSKQGFPIIKVEGVSGTHVSKVASGTYIQTTNVFVVKGTKSPSVVPVNPNWSPK